MVYYEIKKVFARRSGKCALLVLAGLLVIVLYFMLADTTWVNNEGEGETGLSAIKKITEAKQEWSGILTEEKIRQVIEENNRINQTPESNSDEIREMDIAYGWKQGFADIRDLLNYSFGDSSEYDYYTADGLTPEMAGDFYANRTDSLREWLEEGETDGDVPFSDEEKAFLIGQYEKLATPFFYEYQDGWKNLFKGIPAVDMITVMVLGFLCAGIFADEFRLKASAVFYSSCHGRGRAIRAKVQAGLAIATVIYWVEILLYSAAVLGLFGAQGINCPIQSTMSGWKSFYNLTNGQAYLLIVFGGYLGCIFMTALVMLVSAALKSSLLAVIVPFVLIFLPSFLMGINSSVLSKILGLLPDQLLQMNMVVKYFNLYKVGGRIVGAVPVLIAGYFVLTLALVPIIYISYRRHETA